MFQDVMRAAFGRPGFIILTVMQFLYPMIGKFVILWAINSISISRIKYRHIAARVKIICSAITFFLVKYP